MLTIREITELLKGGDDAALFAESARVKEANVGSKVYLRGLVELSNICRRDCLYCGIRCSNSAVERYELTKDEVLGAVDFARQKRFGSVVLQAGERNTKSFIDYVTDLVSAIGSDLATTLSLGEQRRDDYRRWFDAGASRYLLRIESSSRRHFEQIHPAGDSFSNRIKCLELLQNIGYQVGTGVMIGLPGQTVEMLAADLHFMRDFDVDMCGMGPYIEHPDAPLGESRWSIEERFLLTLRMIALLRIIMPTINIAATTALHAIHEDGRERGIAAGANVIMPNITPPIQRAKYLLYSNKPLSDINLDNFDAAYNERGDSKHFLKR